jgi:hypothetical protein
MAKDIYLSKHSSRPGQLFNHILNIKAKKNASIFMKAFPVSITAYNLSLAFLQFRSSKACVKRLTNASSPLRNHTRGS